MVEPLLYKYTEGPAAPKAIEQVSNRVLSRIVDCVVKEYILLAQILFVRSLLRPLQFPNH